MFTGGLRITYFLVLTEGNINSKHIKDINSYMYI